MARRLVLFVADQRGDHENMALEKNFGVDSGRAWVVTAAAFLGAFVSFGTSYTFGIFLKPMSTELHVSHAAMSIVFSTATVISFFLSPFTGRIADCYGPRAVVALGAVLMCAGLVATSWVHFFPLLFVTYGITLGCAVACTYVPSIAAVGEWFVVRRVAALGTAITGVGFGTLVAAPVSAMLIERYDWRSAIRMMGWADGCLLLVSAALCFRPPAMVKPAKIPLRPVLRTRAFVLLYTSLLLAAIAIYVSLVFITAYAINLGTTGIGGAALVGYMGASSVVGRLGLNLLAPRFGLFGMYQFSVAILFLSYVFWIGGHSYSALIIFSLLMGVGYGGIGGLAPAVAAAIFGTRGLGQLLGILFTAYGISCLLGPPIAGLLVDYLHTYRGSPLYAATAAALALLVVIPLRRLAAETAEIGGEAAVTSA
jgi:MFS family permease